MAAPASSPIQEEMKTFTEIRNILNTVLPMISIIPFIPGDIKAKITDL